jgi:ribosomal protein S18 acetylase RimI-like enzyme
MTVELDELIILRKNQLKSASRVLARAFADDPMTLAVYPNTKEGQEKTPYLFEVMLRNSFRTSQIYSISARLEGIAVWERVENKLPSVSIWQYFFSGAIWPAIKIGTRVSQIVQPIFEYTDNLHRELMPVPHWYLLLLGVDPEYQGQGCASKLVKPMLAKIDAEGRPLYLETAKEKNVKMYQHFGFRILEEFIVPNTTLKQWAMIRDPKTNITTL